MKIIDFRDLPKFRAEREEYERFQNAVLEIIRLGTVAEKEAVLEAFESKDAPRLQAILKGIEKRVEPERRRNLIRELNR